MFGLIFQKELKEILRDKKTFWFVVLFPTVILPILMGGAIWFAGQSLSSKQSEVLEFAVEAPEQWQQQIAELLADDEQLSWQQQKLGATIEQTVNQQQLDFVLQLPPDFDHQRLAAQTWLLYYNQAEDIGQFSRVNDRLVPLFNKWQQQHRINLSLSEVELAGLIAPVTIERKGTAAEREDVGQKIGGMLPYMLIFLCMLGAMMPALDIGAGEKERGTLETLLLTPQKRRTIILAKFAVVSCSSVAVALLTVVSGVVWLLGLGQAFALEQLTEIVQAVGFVDLGLVVCLLVPISMTLSALMLAMSIYARSYKEAQSYLAPVQFVAIVPAIIALIPGTELKGAMLWTPIVNVMIASRELVKGTLDYWLLAPIALSNMLVAAAGVMFCVYWFSQERVLFR
ncbi:ABC transporter permease subunit [Ferrimonas lipolytica]|uniref:ABC transporter permease n=1 Tax=Ferrimonas lipolytica TaxID=2724191 RepID=A0A6H1UCM8_9GAMM|nr:ABC transporter permease subunit [Ferrimonas lipolytica]QIZ76835.1 ABC transporter permease [Ferrimonas lipolytica]